MAKEKKSISVTETYETLKSLYYSGKVKPSFNKVVVELKNYPENIELTLLACECLARMKNFEDLAIHAENAIKIAPQNANGFYYKGLATQQKKGQEQDALKNFNHALTLDPENTIYLKSKATTHLALFKDYHLPIQFAEKHRVKAEDSLSKIIEIIENMENPDYRNYHTIGDVSVMVSQLHNAKKYFIRAVNAFEEAEDTDKDMNIYKDLIKSQKACIKEMAKFTE